MKIRFFLILLIFVTGVIYLTAPSPGYPDLENAIRSDEPGDTWQNPDQKGFYTNLERNEVLSQMQTKFTLKIFGFSVPSYRLNYPPEDSQSLIRDQLKSNYFEEIVYPFRESLFVSGWEPKNAPAYAGKPEKEIPEITFLEIPYLSKVTLKQNQSSVSARLFIWTLLFPTTYLIYESIRKTCKNNV